MPTTSSSKSGKAPAPERAPDEASQGQQQSAGGASNGGRPSFVPQHVQRQQLSGGQPPMPARMPGGSGSSRLSSVQQTRHVPRGLGGALGRPGQPQQAPAGRSAAATGGAGASYTGTVGGQFTVNYPNDAWFYDSTLASWMMLDPTYESGVMLMNEVVSLARAHGLTLYYDTDDATGYVVDVYAF